MMVALRVIGDPDEVTQILSALGDVLDLEWNGRTYPTRDGQDVRAYLDARPRPATDSAPHVDPDAPPAAR